MSLSLSRTYTSDTQPLPWFSLTQDYGHCISCYSDFRPIGGYSIPSQLGPLNLNTLCWWLQSHLPLHSHLCNFLSSFSFPLTGPFQILPLVILQLHLHAEAASPEDHWGRKGIARHVPNIDYLLIPSFS